MRKPTQQEKVLKALRNANGGKVSTRYFKQVLLISEVNGRISELRTKGYVIATEGADEYGFAYHRLVSEPHKPRQIVEQLPNGSVRVSYV